MTTKQAVSEEPLVVQPSVFNEIRKLGAFDVTACMSCGQCTVSCPLSVSGNEFPRKYIRYAVLGLKDKILSRPEPWLCYYCGDCSQTCPSNADPGMFMAAARRLAIVEYSFLKIGKLFYNKFTAIFTYLAIITIAIVLMPLLTLDSSQWNLTTFNSFTFVSKSIIHNAGMYLAVVIFGIAFIQAIIMLYYLNKGSKTPPDTPLITRLRAVIFSFFKTAIGEGMLEISFRKCESKARWLAHLAIFYGYILLGIATGIIFLADTLIEDPNTMTLLFGTHEGAMVFRGTVKFFAKISGLIGGILLVLGTGFYITKRIIKDDEYFEKSHFSDWIFLLLSFFLGITGFVIDFFIFIVPSMLVFAYYAYAIHLILVFLLIITAVFTKFAHLEYRLLALWYSKYQKIVINTNEVVY